MKDAYIFQGADLSQALEMNIINSKCRLFEKDLGKESCSDIVQNPKPRFIDILILI